MSHENGISILDQALSLAVNDLTKRGMSEDDAHIALVVRLKHLVAPEIFQVADFGLVADLFEAVPEFEKELS